MSTEPAPTEVARQIGGSAFWSTASSVGSQIIRFSLFVVLSRLVSPAEFGTVALASVLIDLLSVMALGGLSDALVMKKHLSDEDADTAFWTNLGTGAVFLCIGLIISPIIATAFKTPQLGPVLSALCLTFVIWPLGATHTARMARELKFKALAIRTLVANVIGALVGIAMAFNGYGVWALVARALVTTVTLVIMSWFAYPWRPRLRFRIGALRALFGLGSKLMGGQLVGQLNGRGVELIAGLLIAPAAVGLLRIGGQCFSMLTQISVAPVAAIAMPLLSRTQGDPVAGREVFAKVCRLSALMIYPVFFGTMAVSSIIFPLMFGPNWALTGAVMPLLCALAIPLQFNMLMSAALASRGAAGAVLKWNLLQAVVGLPLSAVGGFFGLFPLLAFTIARNYLLLPFGLAWLKRNTELSPMVLIKSSVGPLIAAMLMSAAVFGGKLALAPYLGDVARLFVLIPFGAACYATMILTTSRDIRQEAAGWLARKIGRRATA